MAFATAQFVKLTSRDGRLWVQALLQETESRNPRRLVEWSAPLSEMPYFASEVELSPCHLRGGVKKVLQIYRRPQPLKPAL